MSDKPKVMFRAKTGIEIATEHLMLYGMEEGVKSARAVILQWVEWAYDTGKGKDIPPPFLDEKQIKREIKW